jgi:hypothetical protein
MKKRDFRAHLWRSGSLAMVLVAGSAAGGFGQERSPKTGWDDSEVVEASKASPTAKGINNASNHYRESKLVGL